MSNLSGVELTFEYTDNDDDDEDDDEAQEGLEGDVDESQSQQEEDDEDTNARRPVYITREQIMQLLGHAGLGRIFASDFITAPGRRRRVEDDEDEEDEEEDEDNDDGTGYAIGSRGTSGRRRRPRGSAAYEKVPSDQGRELMQTGTFGSNPRQEDTIKRKKRIAYNIMRRELGLGSDGRQKNSTRLLKQDMIPESVADTIIHYNARCYSGQFSDDGNFFFSCAQDFRVRMYDTSNPYDWKYYKVRSNLRES